MKKSLLLFFATTILTSSNVFTQTVLDWTTTAGVKMHDVQWTNSGEIFAVGEFRGTTNFGGITLTANPWNGGTNNDGVLLRLDIFGNILMAMEIATDDGPGEALHLKATNNHLYIGCSDEPNDLEDYALIEKRTYGGGLVWQQAIHASDILRIHDLELDDSENVYVLYEHALTDVVKIRKYDSGGNELSDNLVSLTSQVAFQQMVPDNLGNSFVVGDNNISLLLYKIDQSGNQNWQRVIGGTGQYTNGEAIAIDDSANLYVSGFFTETVDFGNGYVLSTGSLTTNPVYHYIAKFDSSGNTLWARSYGRTVPYHDDYEIKISRDKQRLLFIKDDTLMQTGISGNLMSKTRLATDGDYIGIGAGPGLDVYVAGRLLSGGSHSGKIHRVSCVAPAVDIGTDLTVCEGSNIQLSSLLGPVDWLDQNGALLATNSSTYSLTANTTTTITARKYDTVGCPGFDDVLITVLPNFDTTIHVEICSDETYMAGGALQSTSGIYADTLTSSNGCDSVVWTNLTVNQVPATPTVNLNGPTTFCEEEVSLSTAMMPGYQWYLNGASIPGETADSILPMTSGFYSVEVFDSLGCSSLSNFAAVNVLDAPETPTIMLSDSNILCQGENVTLTSSSAINNQWSSGSTDQSITVNSTGSFSVTVTNPNGCAKISETVSITVNPVPSAPTITLLGNTLASSSLTDNQWYVDGNAIAGANQQFHSPGQSGRYQASVSNQFGCEAFSNPIVFGCQVAASYTATSQEICEGESIAFSSASTNANQYDWLIDGVSFSGGVNTVRGFPTPGNFDISLVASDNGGCLDTFSTTITVNATPSAATITPLGPTSFCDGDSVILFSSQATGNIWSTGETGQNTSVNSNGTVYHNYIDDNGCTSDTAMLAVTVFASPTIPTISEIGGTLASSSVSGNQWLLNGIPIAGANTQFYSPQGNGNFQVMVTNVNGCIGISSPFVICGAVADFSASADTVCPGDIVIFTNTSTGADSYLWLVGNDTLSTSNNLNWSASSAGSYLVILQAWESGSCFSETTMPIVVENGASVSTGNDTSICYGESVGLMASGAATYQWSPTTGLDNPAISNPVAAPTATTTYTVTATDVSGCISTASVTVVIDTSTVCICTAPANVIKSVLGDDITLTWDVNPFIDRTQVQLRVKPNQAGSVANMITTFANNTNTKTIDFNEANCGLFYQARVRHICTADGSIRSGWKQVPVIPTIPCIRMGSPDLTLDIFPNPTHGIVSLQLMNAEASNEAQITIKDMLGRTHQKRELSLMEGLSTVTLDLTSLPSGVYVMEVTLGKNKLTHRIIKN